MGFFDFFKDNTKNRTNTGARINPFETENVENNQNNGTKGPVAVYSPTSYRDVETIIDALKSGKTAIVHLTDLKVETSIRILDMLSGAIYAMNGGVYEMEKNIFMFSPTGVEVK